MKGVLAPSGRGPILGKLEEASPAGNGREKGERSPLQEPLGKREAELKTTQKAQS